MTGRYLGVDPGTKRIGLAIGEAESGVVTPLDVLTARPVAAENVRGILEVAREYEPAGIVVGLPLNMDGTEGPQAKHSRLLAAALQRATTLPVILHDERLTSFAADQRLTGRDLTRKQKKVRQDAMAAAALLQSFFERGETSR